MVFLITGVAGFIGARTAELLLNEKHQVIGIDNLNDYYDVKIKDYRLSILNKFEGFKFILGDIELHDTLEKIFKENHIDKVINLAARAGVRYSLENPFIYAQTNLMGSLNLLDLMRKHGVKKYIMASTSSIYAGSHMPYKEDLAVNNPISPYAASKKSAELMAYTYHYQFDIDVTILRYFTVYGPAGRPDMSVLRFIKWIDEEKPILLYGDGSQARDFTFIDDIARGTINAASTKTGFEIINLGGGNKPVSILQLISKIEGLIHKKAIIDNKPFHNADVDCTWADISKASKILEWQPEVALEEGIASTVEWYLENKEWLSKIDFHDK
jgi:UDP-glucuronate 4-epimerase